MHSRAQPLSSFFLCDFVVKSEFYRRFLLWLLVSPFSGTRKEPLLLVQLCPCFGKRKPHLLRNAFIIYVLYPESFRARQLKMRTCIGSTPAWSLRGGTGPSQVFHFRDRVTRLMHQRDFTEWVCEKHNPTPSFVFVAVELDMSSVTQWRMDSAWSQPCKVPTKVKEYYYSYYSSSLSRDTVNAVDGSEFVFHLIYFYCSL